MFLLVLVCCMSVCPSDYLKRNKQMCMIYLLEVCLEPRNNRLDFGDDPDLTDLHLIFTRGASRTKVQFVKLWE